MKYDVAVIGCGPVGALAANLLAKAGLSSVVIEKELACHPLPRAVHIDHEMMRLLQSASVIDSVLPDMVATEGHLHVGADNGVIRYMGTAGQTRPFGWSNDYFFYQPELEAHLRGAFKNHSNIDLRLGVAFKSLEQNDDGVSITISDHEDNIEKINTRWVIACDGSKSDVRKFLDIQLDDLKFNEPWLVIDAEVNGPLTFSKIAGLPEEANLQKLSIMMCDPNRPATIVPGRKNHRRWEMMLLPGEDDQKMMKSEKVAELIRPWLEGVDHKIIRASTYRFHGLVAEKWKKGRVFLAGDASHQTPPFFGQGMCHGFRDIANLVWKMALIHSGKFNERLLDTYQQEREPSVRGVIAKVVEAGRYICMLDAKDAARRDAELRNTSVNTSTKKAVDLIPIIAAGVVATEFKGAGKRFIQPRMQDGSDEILLDDVTGDGWRVFAEDAELADKLKTMVTKMLPDMSFNVVNISTLNDEGALEQWLKEHDSNLVVIRPDFYVFGAAFGADQAKKLLSILKETLCTIE